ncbi:hypothetical protein [Spirilliplanes yamanashiensis]|uniref:Lipoprotein n=1 Tax=Spirilliplanes yamanashiensis TaxID=42233 RepID=A0A8J3Y597_9ACTN|nr:hypothetical protein [Spirilliplanes yamanashiensis]MDP9819163.1 hypothetical protein [Spirilliplanes yamanashiensis]GIJ02013.1 lipoprotein [Spirilliplanes yamanashiensis]
MRTRTLALAAAAAVLLTGCQRTGDAGSPAPVASATQPAAAGNGVAELAADEILQRSQAAVERAESFRMQGDLSNEGERMTFDFKTDGRDLTGFMTKGAEKIGLLSVGGKQYVRPNERFLAQMSGEPAKARKVARRMGDRWVELTDKDQNLAGVFGAVSIGQWLDVAGKVTKGPVKEIDGTPAIGLVHEGTTGGTLYVATAGEPYPLRIEAPGTEKGQIDISDFGATFPELKAPARAEVTTFAQLMN